MLKGTVAWDLFVSFYLVNLFHNSNVDIVERLKYSTTAMKF
jgi:hypothetical protein